SDLDNKLSRKNREIVVVDHSCDNGGLFHSLDQVWNDERKARLIGSGYPRERAKLFDHGRVAYGHLQLQRIGGAFSEPESVGRVVGVVNDMIGENSLAHQMRAGIALPDSHPEE